MFSISQSSVNFSIFCYDFRILRSDYRPTAFDKHPKNCHLAHFFDILPKLLAISPLI